MPVRFRLAGSIRTLAALLLAGVAASCNTPKLGQSGSEELPTPPNGGGGSTVPCPCMAQLGDRASGLRVTLLDQAGAVAKLRVDEVLAGASSLEPGDVIEGQRFDDTLACYVGCASIGVGEQAFAFFVQDVEAKGRPACSARNACVESCQDQRASDRASDEAERTFDCTCRHQAAPLDQRFSSPTCGGRVGDFTRACQRECEASEEACADGESIAAIGSVRLSPWSDPLVFARGERDREISVPVSELLQLWPVADESPHDAAERCQARFGDWADLLDNASGL